MGVLGGVLDGVLGGVGGGEEENLHPEKEDLGEKKGEFSCVETHVFGLWWTEDRLPPDRATSVTVPSAVVLLSSKLGLGIECLGRGGGSSAAAERALSSTSIS